MLQELAIMESPWDFLLNRNIILYGAGSLGERFCAELESVDISITAFCDSSPDKVGTVFCGVPVIGSEDLKKQDTGKSLLIISTEYVGEIYEFLLNNHIWEGDICSSFAVSAGLWYSMQEEKDVPERAKKYWIQKKEFIKFEHIYKDAHRDWSLGQREMRTILFRKPSLPGPFYLIYQPGKVASSSIYDELKTLGKNCFHIHSMDKIGSAEEQEFIHGLLRKSKIKIVTGVRDPVSRGISNTFQNCSRCWISHRPDRSFIDSVKIHTALQTPLVKEYFTTDNFYSDMYSTSKMLKYGWMFDWFDMNIKDNLGIDIFEEPFDKEKGYTVIKRENVEIFVYKLEKLSGLEKELREFLEIENFSLRRSNDASNKSYSLLYRYVKENIKFSEEFLDFYYLDNPRMKHFYTEKEIEQFRKKWSE